MNRIAVLLLAGSLTVMSCNESPKDAAPVAPATPVTPTPVEPPAAPVKDSTVTTVTGKVTGVKNGKDGYTAAVETSDRKTYYVTISHANLKDPAQYRTVAVGETLTVEGEAWKMGTEEQVTVRAIK